MAIATNLLQSLVPISQFNKGQAAKIFDRLHSERELIVLKNNQPSAIILSPEEYTRLTEIEEDYFCTKSYDEHALYVRTGTQCFGNPRGWERLYNKTVTEVIIKIRTHWGQALENWNKVYKKCLNIL